MRSERQFCEWLRYDLLFTWFLDLNISDEPFDASTFSKNRARRTQHVAQHDRRGRSAVDGRTTRHRGYRQSQKRRNLVRMARLEAAGA